MPVDYHYYLAKIERRPAPGTGADAWQPPAGWVGWVDLRPTTDTARTNEVGLIHPFGFVAMRDQIAQSEVDRLGHLYLGRGDCREIGLTGASLNGWNSRMGYRPSAGTLAEIIVDQMTTGADPDGDTAVPPLMPSGPPTTLEIHLGGHSPIWKERFQWGNRHTNKIQARLQREYGRMDDDVRRPGSRMRAETPRMVLDWWCDYYGLQGTDDWKQLIPARLRAGHPGRLKHETTQSDNFNGADSDTMGVQLSWTEGSGDWDILTNRGVRGTAAEGSGIWCRADADVSSPSHYADIEFSNTSGWNDITAGGIGCRWSASAHTCYQHYMYRSSGAFIAEFLYWSAGSASILGTPAGLTPANNDVFRIQASGSTLTRYRNGGLIETITDNNITGNTRGGLQSYANTGGGSLPAFDNYLIADLATASALPMAWAQYRRRHG